MEKNYKIIPKLTPSLLAHFSSQGKWKFAEHLKLIQNKIFDALTGEKRFLIVTLPPRHGKSEFISKYFSFWFLMNFPMNE